MKSDGNKWFKKFALVTLAAVLLAAPIVAHAAPPPPVPPILDQDRFQSYVLNSPTPSVDVDFPVFGDCTDLVVQLNGVILTLNTDFTCASTSGGSDLTILPLPITDLVITFATQPTTNLPTVPPSSGTLTITGAWHPRDLVQPTSPGINRREFNQAVSTLIAAQREFYHFENNLPMGGQGSVAPGGNGQLAYYDGAGIALAGFTPTGDCAVTIPSILCGSIGGKAVTLGGAFSTSGAYPLAFTLTGITNLTLPQSGTLATTAPFTSGAAGLVPASGGGMANYLRADGTWTAPPGSASSALSVKSYGGAKGDTLSFADGAITSSTAAFSSASATFTSGDVGKVIRVVGAGSAGATLQTTISAYTSAHAVTLAANASTTVSAATYYYGTDDTTAIQNTITQALATGYPVYLDPGTYITTAALTVGAPLHIYGEGGLVSVIQPSGATDGIDISTATQLPTIFEKFGVSYASAANTGTYAISLTGTTGNGISSSIFRDMESLNAYECLYVSDAVAWNVDNLKCILYTKSGIAVQNASPGNGDAGDDKIVNSYIQGASQSGTSCIQWISSGSLHLVNNDCLTAQYGVNAELESGLTTGQLIIANNTFDGACASAALSFTRLGSTGTYSRVNVEGNGFNLCHIGVDVPTDANGTWLSQLDILGNYYYDDGSSGAYFAIIANAATGVVISDNTAQSTVSTDILIETGATVVGVVGPNIKLGTWTANGIGADMTTIAPN